MTWFYKCEILPYLVVTYHLSFSKAEHVGTKQTPPLSSVAEFVIYMLYLLCNLVVRSFYLVQCLLKH